MAYAAIVAVVGVVVMMLLPGDVSLPNAGYRDSGVDFPRISLTPLPPLDAMSASGEFRLNDDGFSSDEPLVIQDAIPPPPPYLALPGRGDGGGNPANPSALDSDRPNPNDGAASNPAPGTFGGIAGSRTHFMIYVRGATSDRGVIRIAVYGDAETFNQPDLAVISRSVPVEDGRGFYPVAVDAVPRVISVAAYHDENNNGQLDRNLLGIPREAYGFTNRARGILGPPTYDETTLQRPPAGTELRLVLRR